MFEETKLEDVKVSSRKMALIGQIRLTLICGIFIALGLSFVKKAPVLSLIFCCLWLAVLALYGIFILIYYTHYAVFANSEYILIKQKIFVRTTITVKKSEVAAYKSYQTPLMRMLSVKNLILCLPGAKISIKGVRKHLKVL